MVQRAQPCAGRGGEGWGAAAPAVKGHPPAAEEGVEREGHDAAQSSCARGALGEPGDGWASLSGGKAPLRG